VSQQQFLTFDIDTDTYAIDIDCVEEIFGWREVREIPNTPDYLLGVWNWRGKVIPVVDLRVRFGSEQVTYTKKTVAIVVSTTQCFDAEATVDAKQTGITLALIVDAVADVIEVTDDEIEQAPNFGEKIETQFVKGMIAANNKMIVCLDEHSLIDMDQLAAV